MLDFLYSDDITIKTKSSGDEYRGYSYTTSTIKGCLQPKTKQVIDNNGTLITTNLLLNSNEDLLSTTLVVYNGVDREIKAKNVIVNHLTGSIDHYEYAL